MLQNVTLTTWMQLYNNPMHINM